MPADRQQGNKAYATKTKTDGQQHCRKSAISLSVSFITDMAHSTIYIIISEMPLRQRHAGALPI